MAGKKRRFVNELIETSSFCWIKISSDELQELVEKGLDRNSSTGDVKEFLFEARGIEIVRKVREGVKSVLAKYGIRDAKQLAEALASMKGQ